MQVVLVDARYAQGHKQQNPAQGRGQARSLIPAGSPAEKLPRWMASSLSLADNGYGYSHIHASLAKFYREVQSG
jgi:hypothetical protein